jgi:hypothetical protein
VASIVLHGLSSQQEAAGAAGKIERAENSFEQQPAAKQVEIVLNESGVVNISTPPMMAARSFAPLDESIFTIHLRTW